jgi:hypothetical protein
VRILLAVALLLWAGSAQAQVATNCSTYDTTVLTSGTASALANCTINSGPYDTIYVMAVGEVTCGPVGDIALILVAGTGPASTPYGSLGANFNGSIASSVLTISSMITPYPEFAVRVDQTVSNSSLSWSGGIVTVTTSAPHSFNIIGSRIIISGATPSGYNGTYAIRSIADSTHLTYALDSDPGSETVAGSTTYPGQLLNDGQSGAGIPTSTVTVNGGSSITITGQLTSTEAGGALGGRGTYSVSNASGVTVALEPIWALNVGVSLGGPPNSRQISRGPIEYLRCQDGTTGIITLVGGYPPNTFAPNLQMWVAILISSEQIGSGSPIQSATWKNGQISMFSPGLSYFGGVLNGLGGAH